MSDNKLLDRRVLWGLFSLTVLFMLVATLYPFHFHPPENDATWLADSPGLYFNGRGIAHTQKTSEISLQQGISVEVLLKERPGSKNWGPREIISYYDGSASPSLLLGQWGGHLFLYSRFEPNKGEKWYKQFRTKDRLVRRISHLVTVTFNNDEKALYIDGELSNKKKTDTLQKGDAFFSGRLILGNSPIGRDGWWGEIKGIAIYDRILSALEVEKHNLLVFQKGMQGLAEEPDCLLLYSFDEGEGTTAGNIIGEADPFYIPAGRVAFIKTILNFPHKNMRIEFLSGYPLKDFVANIFFFIPYGILLSLLLFREFSFRSLPAFLIVISSAGFFSLTVEVVQFSLPTRTPAVTDVIANMIGSGLGFLPPFFKVTK